MKQLKLEGGGAGLSLAASPVVGSFWCPPVWGSGQELEGMGGWRWLGDVFGGIKSNTKKHAYRQKHL